MGECGIVRVIVLAAVGLLGSRSVGGMAVNAAGVSRQPQTLGPLVGGVGGLGKVAPAIGTNATHDERVLRNDC